MLILDEPMTGLDVESESAVRAALRHLMAGRTSLLITHDLLSAAECDQIVILEQGTIVECGSHEDLLARSARYRDLWDMKSAQYEEQRAGLFLGARAIPAVSQW